MPEIVNVDQAAAWDGPRGESWVAHEDRQNRALAAHTERLLDAAAVARSDHVLDIGCGTGETTRACARSAADGDALGVDLSTVMLERARQRAAEAGLRNVTFERADAQVHPFPVARADVVVSRFGTMFFADAVAAFTNIARGTAAGGRLALVVWQALELNEWVRVPRDALALGRSLPPPAAGAPGPFSLADADHVRGVLGKAGFTDVQVEDFGAPFHLGANADEAVAFARDVGVLREVLDDLDATQAARALDALQRAMAARQSDDGVVLDSRTWVVTAVR